MPYSTYLGTNCPFYEADPSIAEIVNFAIRLRRPLLVEGEPGCGKTMLASAIAHELQLGEPISMTVKSTFQAKDLLYRFNALRRLQDIQDPARPEEAKYVFPYIDLQPLGRAILESKPSVVLIDEIDKADIDFPNDLLEVLGAFAFDIDEMPAGEDQKCYDERKFRRRVTGGSGDQPIVIITSNREKQLPEPFLRRCLYLELKFPEDEKTLATIIRKNLGEDANDIAEDLVTKAIKRFLDVRKLSQQTGAQKPPATSELIDWIRVLHWQKETGDSVEKPGAVPYWKVLFKTMQDQDAIARKQV